MQPHKTTTAQHKALGHRCSTLGVTVTRSPIQTRARPLHDLKCGRCTLGQPHVKVHFGVALARSIYIFRTAGNPESKIWREDPLLLKGFAKGFHTKAGDVHWGRVAGRNYLCWPQIAQPCNPYTLCPSLCRAHGGTSACFGTVMLCNRSAANIIQLTVLAWWRSRCLSGSITAQVQEKVLTIADRIWRRVSTQGRSSRLGDWAPVKDETNWNEQRNM